MWRKILRGAGTVTKIAGPAVAGLGLGGPIGAVVTVAGQLAGAAVKDKGKKREHATGGPPTHKITAPAASVSVSAAVMVLLAKFGIQMPAETVELLLAVIPVLMHQFGNGAVNASEPRR